MGAPELLLLRIPLRCADQRRLPDVPGEVEREAHEHIDLGKLPTAHGRDLKEDQRHGEEVAV